MNCGYCFSNYVLLDFVLAIFLSLPLSFFLSLKQQHHTYCRNFVSKFRIELRVRTRVLQVVVTSGMPV